MFKIETGDLITIKLHPSQWLVDQYGNQITSAILFEAFGYKNIEDFLAVIESKKLLKQEQAVTLKTPAGVPLNGLVVNDYEYQIRQKSRVYTIIRMYHVLAGHTKTPLWFPESDIKPLEIENVVID